MTQSVIVVLDEDHEGECKTSLYMKVLFCIIENYSDHESEV